MTTSCRTPLVSNVGRASACAGLQSRCLKGPLHPGAGGLKPRRTLKPAPHSPLLSSRLPAFALALALATGCSRPASSVRLAVGGQAALRFFPVYLAREL